MLPKFLSLTGFLVCRSDIAPCTHVDSVFGAKSDMVWCCHWREILKGSTRFQTKGKRSWLHSQARAEKSGLGLAEVGAHTLVTLGTFSIFAFMQPSVPWALPNLVIVSSDQGDTLFRY